MSAIVQVNEAAAPAAEASAEKKQSCPHPIACFFHIFFKVLAIGMYLVLWWKVDFVISFVIITFCLAFDFWTTKNVTGRLMVGLRWWNDVQADGTSVWRFECLPDNEKGRLNQLEGLIFWGALLLTPCIWVACLLAALISVTPDIQWAVLVAIAIALSIVNLGGYVKCARGARAQVRKLALKAATKAATTAVLSSAS